MAFYFSLSYFSFLAEINTYLLIIAGGLLVSSLLKLIYTEEIKFTNEGLTILEIKSLMVKSFVLFWRQPHVHFLLISPRFFFGCLYRWRFIRSSRYLFICFYIVWDGLILIGNDIFSNLNKVNDRFSFSLRFFTQNILVGVFFALFAFFILPYPVSIFFKINLNLYMKIMQQIFLSFIGFNLGMSALNLFKWTNKPVIESYSYFLAFIIPFLYGAWFGGIYLKYITFYQYQGL